MATDRPTDWFHGKLTRDEAEKVLRDNGFAEGLFLVRESHSSEGDFVISVVHAVDVIHYQVRRRGEDALFSLSEEEKVVHGLDELVFYYKYNLNSGLQHCLNEYVHNLECPAEVKLHGTENFLHRAAMEGNTTVVYELLRSGYRNVAAKNRDGQCAIHLASFYGKAEVLALLIDHEASVNVADVSGYTPLHCAMHSNRPEAAAILLRQGRANPTLRNQRTGWVPLHEAAFKGHVECCRVLLEWDAPVMPRTPKDETPADLARANGKNQAAYFLDNWPMFQPNSRIEDWLHSAIPRSKAIELLRRGQDDGVFLIRKSGKKPNTLVVSMCYDNKFNHFEIEKRGIYYFLDQGPYMISLEHLVDHYTRFADGLPVELGRPIAPPSSSSPPKLMPKPILSPTVPPRSLPPSTGVAAVQPPAANNSMRYENNETLRRVQHSKDNIPALSIRLKETIGEGEFGSVYKAVYMTEDGNIRDVAVKVINAVEECSKQDFVREANVMMNLDHRCIVQLIGISSGPPVLVVLELVPLGSMLDFLLDHPDSVRADMEMPLWAAQVACGMNFLESRRFIHRDLAARNILLASKLQAKISDFGLSRAINSDKQYYRASKGGRWPIRWYAPECMFYGTFTHQSDVWSYGILLWEMYNYGKQPYEGMKADEVVKFIEENRRLPLPETANFDVQNMMSLCWEKDPELRPKFSELFKFFSENPEYSNLKELLTIQDLGQLVMTTNDLTNRSNYVP